MVVLRTLHTAVRRVYTASPCYAENTMRTVYVVAHYLLCKRDDACKKVFHWLQANAAWEGDKYTDKVIP